MPAVLNKRYYGVEYQANRYRDRDAEPESRKALSPSDSPSSSPLRSPKGTEDYGQRMTVSDLEEDHESDVASSSGNEEETRVVVDEHVTVTTKVETEVLEEGVRPSEDIVEETTTTTTETVEVVEEVAEDDAEAFVTVGEVAEEEEHVVEQQTVTTCIVEEVDNENEDGVGDEDADVETEVITTTVTTTTTTTLIVESDDEAVSGSVPSPQTSDDTVVQTLDYSERLSISAPPESPEIAGDHGTHPVEEVVTDKDHSTWKNLLLGLSILPLLALTWAAACQLSPSSKFAAVSHSLVQSATDQWNGSLSSLKAHLSEFLNKIGNPEARISNFFHRCTAWWDHTSVGSAVNKAWTKSSEKLQHYMGELNDEVRTAYAYTADTCASVWERVFPAPNEATSLVESTRENLLDPFEADQQMLNDKLKQLLRKQEAWALEELKRMKKRRVSHASITDSILSDTRVMVLESLQEAKLVASHHIEAYTQTISDELVKSIQRELDEYDQGVREAQQELEHGKEVLVATTQHELEALEQLKAETEKEVDAELDQDTNQVASTKEKLIQELAEIAAFEKEKIEAEYQRVVDAVSQLVEAEDDRLEEEMENVEKEVIEIAAQEEEWIREEDSKLLNELEMLAKLETMRIEAERERALLEVAQIAEKEEERIRQERKQAEALARKLEAEEQRLLAERQRAEAGIAEAARQDALRLEEERKRAEDEILEVRKREQERIQQEVLRTEEELAFIKHQEEELAQQERAKAEAAIAEAVFAEEEQLQRERDIVAVQLALEAKLGEEWLRQERLLADQALEQALEEEECKLCTQEKESEQVLDQAAEEMEKTVRVGHPSGDDTGAVVISDIKIAVVSEVEVIPLLLPEQEQVMVIAEQSSNVSTVDSMPLPSNRSAVGSMLRFPLSIPKMELYPVGLLSAAFAVLGLITAYYLSKRYQRLLAHRRQKTHVFRARRKRWQRRVESNDLEFAEEVVLLSSGSSAELINGHEPEPEVIGYFSDTYTVSEVATEDLSQASSAEELDEAALLTTTRKTTTTSQIFTTPYAEVEEDGEEDDEEEEPTVNQRLVVQQRRVLVETTVAPSEDDEEIETETPQNRFETPTRRSTRTSTRRAISPTS